jgi:polysaccharide export outer membrane protein
VGLGLALSGLAGCGGPNYRTYDYAKEYDPRKHEYVVGIGDSISITVFHQADLSGGGTVRPDGIVTLPLIGDVQCAGKTPGAIRDDVKQRLLAFVKSETAVVTVLVNSVASYRFVVTGNVGHSGSFAQKYFVTVSEAIAMAGGLSKFASEDLVILRPDTNGKIRAIPINYSDVTSGRRPEMDIAIVAGDTIVVP